MKQSIRILLAGAMLFPAAAQAQITVSGIINDGNTITDFSNAETVTATTGNVGYRASNGAVFNHYGPAVGTLAVTGSGTTVFDAYNATPSNPGTDNFRGANNLQNSAVEIGGNVAPVFGNVSFDNGAGNPVSITNTAGIIVARNLHFGSGIISTIRSNHANGAIHFINGALFSNTAAGDGQYVNGYMRMTGTNPFMFNVGDQFNVDIRPFGVNGMTNATTSVAAAYWKGDPGTALDPTGGAHPRNSLNTTPLNGEVLASVSPIGFWDFIPVVGTENINLTALLPDLSVNGGYTNVSAVRMVGWNTSNGQWELLGNSSPPFATEGAPLSGNTGAYAGRNMSSYSAIGWGSISQVPLPLQLISFDGAARGCEVALRWETAAEKSIRAIYLDRSRDARYWQQLHETSGAKLSGGGVYSYSDVNPETGANYYRLRIAEGNGNESFSATVCVATDCFNGGIEVAPNPSRDRFLVSGLEAGNALQVRDAAGRLMQQSTATTTSARIEAASWPSGTYWLSVQRDGRQISGVKLVKQ